MVVFIVFCVVIGLWLVRSVVIAATGAEWFIELHHGDVIPKVDKALKITKVLGLVFMAFVTPLMFVAGSIAALLLYLGGLKGAVKQAEMEYVAAEHELQQEQERSGKEETPSVP